MGYNTIQQHEPLRVPSNWGTQEKKFVSQLEEILDDIYKRFGRLRMEDLGDALKGTIKTTSDGVEKNSTAIQHNSEQILLRATSEQVVGAQNTANAAQAAADAAAAGVSDLERRIQEAEFKIQSDQIVGTVTSSEQYKQDQAALTAAATKAQDAASNAEKEALTAAGIAAEKGKVWFQSTAPEGNANDLWIDITDGLNTPKRWNGTAWEAVTDKVAVDAANAAATAKSTADTLDNLLNAPGGIVERLNSAELKIKDDAIIGTVTSSEQYKQDQSNLAKAVEEAKNTANAASGDALTAAGIAAEKGKVWFQSTAPEGNANDLWIDITDGLNTPKRWNGTAWEAVTDKVAVDAANAAVKAQDAANAAQAAANDAKEAADKKVTSSESIQTAEDIQNIFREIGLAGEKIGIVTANKDGIQVEHSDIGGHTQMNADGFRLYDAQGNVIGGLIVMRGQTVSAVQRLANTRDTTFYVAVSPNIYGDGENGLEFVIADVNCGAITAQYLDGDVAGLRIRSNGNIGFQAGEKYASFSGVYGMGRHIYFGSEDPGGADGDIWLFPTED